jgi:hypothetical protein
MVCEVVPTSSLAAEYVKFEKTKNAKQLALGRRSGCWQKFFFSEDDFND